MKNDTIQKDDASRRSYLNDTHRLGRFGIVGAIIVFLALPTALGLYFHALPPLSQVLAGSVGLLAIFIPISISELIAYTPILGSSTYLSTITGNVLNLKVPAVQNALRQLDVEPGTEEADIVAVIAVSASAFVTVIVLIAGVLLLIPLRPIFALPAVQTATNNILPALFGALTLSLLSGDIGGGIKAPARLKGAILPAILVAGLTLVNNFLVRNFDFMSQLQGFVIVVMIPVTYFSTKWLYRRGSIKVILPEDALPHGEKT